MFPRRTSTNARFAAAAVVCALALCGPARAGDEEPDLRPKPVRGLELKNRLGASVPRDLVFTDSTGKQVTLGWYFPRQVGESGAGRPVVMTLIYYKCPVMCPTLMEKLTDALNKMDFTVGNEYDVLVVSFDGRDSAQDAAREKAGQLMYYARPTDDTIRAGWNYLVTQPENVRVLADAVGFPYRYLPSAGEYSHGPVVMVLTPDGRVSRYFTGSRTRRDSRRTCVWRWWRPRAGGSERRSTGCSCGVTTGARRMGRTRCRRCGSCRSAGFSRCWRSARRWARCWCRSVAVGARPARRAGPGARRRRREQHY